MVYASQTWTDGSAGGTPLSATRLDWMEAGIAEAHELYDLSLGALEVAEVNTGESTTSTSPTDLFTVGPQFDVVVPTSGRALVFLAAQLRSGFNAGIVMGVEGSGPTPVAPSQERALRFRPHAATGDGHIQAGTFFLLESLAAGNYTWTAKYWTPEGESVVINHRRMLVIPLP